MSEMPSSYHIDYAHLDVVDLMRQVQARAHGRSESDPFLPAPAVADLRERLRDYLDLDDAAPYAVQQELGLTGAWNVTPEDLRQSHPGAVGAAIGALRRALRPALKLLANLDLPLYKQFKVNLGLASAVHDLLQENEKLRRSVGDLRQRVERLEGTDGGSNGGS